MCDWMAQAADLVNPLYEQMKERVLRSKAVQTDDTPVPVLDPELPRTRTGRIWTYVGDEEHPYTVYDYTPTRSRDGPDAFLKPFTGYLQADAYSGYDQIYADPERAVVEAACWAHARRKFYEAQSSDLMRAMVMLAYVRLLYDVEREAGDQNLEGEERRALRQAKSLPILADIHAYLERERPKVLPKSPEGQAMAYTLSNWEALVRYCEDGDWRSTTTVRSAVFAAWRWAGRTGCFSAATMAAGRRPCSTASLPVASGSISIRSPIYATYSSASRDIRRTSSEICCPTSGRRHGQRRPPDCAPHVGLFLREIGGAFSTTASWHPARDGFAGRIPSTKRSRKSGAAKCAA